MDDNTYAALLFSIVGIIYIGLGIPLLLGRIPLNHGTAAAHRKRYRVRNLVSGKSRHWPLYDHFRGCRNNQRFRSFYLSRITWTEPWRRDSSSRLSAVSTRNGC